MKTKTEIVEVKVSGSIKMSRENFDVIMGYEDPHTGLVFSIHMAFVDSTGLSFETEE